LQVNSGSRKLLISETEDHSTAPQMLRIAYAGDRKSATVYDIERSKAEQRK